MRKKKIYTLRNLTVTTVTLKRFYTKTFIINHLQCFTKTSNTKIRYKIPQISPSKASKDKQKAFVTMLFLYLAQNMRNAEF